jgi:hypothetical protein
MRPQPLWIAQGFGGWGFAEGINKFQDLLLFLGWQSPHFFQNGFFDAHGNLFPLRAACAAGAAAISCWSVSFILDQRRRHHGIPEYPLNS